MAINRSMLFDIDQNIVQLPANSQFIEIEVESQQKQKKIKKAVKDIKLQNPQINIVTIQKNLFKAVEKQVKENEKLQKQKEDKKKKPKLNLDAVQSQQSKVARKPPAKRQKLNDEDEEEKQIERHQDMIQVQNHQFDVQQNQDVVQIDEIMKVNDQMLLNQQEPDQVEQNGHEQVKKREKKAAAKKIPKPKKVYEPPQPRQDVDIPDLIWHRNSKTNELPTNCCQTCSNRNCARAVNIDSLELFIKCQKSKAHVSSLIEHIAPELRYSALEVAIQNNRRQILEILLSETKPESEGRIKKRDTQITSFETGQVGLMAFGYKVRKVQMMRGNRQGNNAFTEDPTHQYQTPIEYLTTDEYCVEKCFQQDGVDKDTFELLKQHLADKFEPFINQKALPIIMSHGCYNSLVSLFEVMGYKENDIQNNFFNRAYHQLLTAQAPEEIKFDEQIMTEVKRNNVYNYTFVAALNPSGAGLRYLEQNNHEIDFNVLHLSTSHFAAVCPTDENLKILIKSQVNLHDQDRKKKTPLMWAFIGRKPFQNIVTIMQTLNKVEKDSKDDLKLMALHYFCKFGLDQNLTVQEREEKTIQVMNYFVENKAKFSQVAGYNKYTPLIYACTYGHIEIAKYLIENIPRLNIDKGDKYLRTPLAMACRNGHADIAALLIKYNADINKGDSSGNTPLHYAAAYGWVQCVELLNKYGADPSPENAWKSTPITIALQKNHIETVKELLKSQDINVDSKDDDGRTLLSLSMVNINSESYDFIDLLINQKGANVNHQDAKGRTPLYSLIESMTKRKPGLFSEYEDLEMKIIKLLLISGADLNLKTKDGKSAFSFAFENGMSDLLVYFGQGIELDKDPSLLFAFSGVSILKGNIQNLIVSCFKSQKKHNGKAVEDETINFVNDDGFTPLLYYIWEVCQTKDQVLRSIQKLIDSKDGNINNENILNNILIDQINVAAISDKAKKIYIDEIIEPFVQFIKFLIENGANPNAYILKLKPYRDDNIPMTQVSQHSQLIAVGGRRPPEKEQYLSMKLNKEESLGLNSVLHLLMEDQISTIRELFDFFIGLKGIELNQVNFMKMTPFFKLVKTRNIKDNQDYKYCFEKLLSTGQVDIDAPDQFGMSAFWYFYSNNRVEEAFYLVDKGANINHMDNYGFFALKKELYNGNYPMMQRLMDKKADPDLPDEFKRTILHHSCDFSHRKDYKELFKILIKYKANLGAVDFKGRTPLHYMFVKRNKRFQIDQFDPLNHGLDILVSKDTKNMIDINHQDTNGKSIIHYAAQRGSVNSLEYLIKIFGEECINFDAEDVNRNTPLAIAVGSKQIQFAQKLIDLKKVKLLSFIYEEKLQRPAQNNNNGGLNLGQDDEQSDLEFMQVQNANIYFDEKNKNQKHDKDALNLFRYIIRNKLDILENLFIQNGYDRIQMIVDYICEGHIEKLFKVIETYFKNQEGAQGSILIQKNQKGQNLIHVLARNAHLVKNFSEMTKFYGILVREGVDPKELDNKNRSALMHAMRSGNFHFIKFLVEEEKFDVNHKDSKGANSIAYLLKGDRIITASVKILQFLILSKADVDVIYQEQIYLNDQENNGDNFGIEEFKQNDLRYQTTPVIHAIRHPSKIRENIRLILKELLLHAHPSKQDSTGKDAFFYTAIRNHYNTFNFILDTLEEEHKSFDLIVKDQVCNLGKSFIHYIVNPIEFGSFENTELLKKAIEVGFKHDIRDRNGKTPYEYACLQKSNQMKKVFEELNLVDKDEIMLEQINNHQDFNFKVYLDIDFEADAKDYLLSIQMQIDPLKIVPCDLSGKFNDDCVVMYDDHTEQYFDVYMTRVEIGKFQPGGDYLFYKMQLVLDKSRDLAILLTRWGRIGEEGAFQKTPFNTHDDAIKEFKSIFEQKSGNKWCKFDNFRKNWKKFQLMRPNYVTIDQQNYLAPFNLENAQKPNQQYIQQASSDILREICDVNTYLRALQRSGVDLKAMPFSNLDRQNLYNALEVLQKLHKTLIKLEQMNPRPYAESERNKLLATREKMWYLSSRFYEFIPHEEFRNKMVPPISTIDMLLQKSGIIQSLIEIEAASKILLGAHHQSVQINPLEYCLRATGVRMQVLDMKRDKSEYDLLNEYVNNTYIENQRRMQVKNIFRLTKFDQKDQFRNDLENRVLLFHGSKMSNFLGILKHGLRVQPLAIQRNGQLLGKGIYFSDIISKAIQYTEDPKAGSSASRLVVVCEVALGNIKELTRHNLNYEFEEGVDSVQGVGRQAPQTNVRVILPDGAILPLGKVENQANYQNSDFQFNEFVVKQANQVQIRYLIQFK